MKQVILNPRTGKIEVVDVPAPKPEKGQVLVRNLFSVISAGTERDKVNFAQMGLIKKAKSRPELVKQVLNKVKQDGILNTINAIINRLDTPISLGYSTAGIVEEVNDVREIKVGDRVACGGGGYATHSEVIVVPKNLVVKLPDNVEFEEGAFATLGAIAMQGVRLSNLKVGEIAVVIGLGLLGQLTHQILKASGVKVVGFDISKGRVELALNLGIDFATENTKELYSIVNQVTNGYGADAIIITAGTRSNTPIELAGELARKKATVVVVGAVGLNVPRKPYYEKELNLVISSSYGPGRYDPEYEEKGKDYPYGYVRWTENRNMQAFLDLIAMGKVKVKPLITHVFSINEAPLGYELITKTPEKALGVLVKYPLDTEIGERKVVVTQISAKKTKTDNSQSLSLLPMIGVLGAGSFAMSTILPILSKIENIKLIGIASAGGLSARKAGYRFGFKYFTTDENEIINDSQINTLFILTRHNLHAKQVISALRAGKNVYVEKPLCIKKEELDDIISTYNELEKPPYLFVGFNRRFAPFIQEIKTVLQKVYEPLILNYRVNAGFIPKEHWIQDDEIGGGRLIGEGCHFIDLLIYLANSKVVEVRTEGLPNIGKYSYDNFVITLKFSNGSIGIITYTANGDKMMGKEYLEIFGGGVSVRMNDYQSLEIYSDDYNLKRRSFLFKDKGHGAEIKSFLSYISGNSNINPMGFDEIVHSSYVTLCAYESLLTGKTIKIDVS